MQCMHHTSQAQPPATDTPHQPIQSNPPLQSNPIQSDPPLPAASNAQEDPALVAPPLPHAALQALLDFLTDPRDAATVMLVCKEWRAAGEESRLWDECTLQLTHRWHSLPSWAKRAKLFVGAFEGFATQAMRLHAPRLQSLDVSSTGIHHTFLRCLSQFPSLCALDVANTYLRAETLRLLVAELPKLQKLVARGNEIGDEGVGYIAGLSRLTSLDVSDNGVKLLQAEHLSSLACLRELDVSFNEFKGVHHLTALTNLQSLRVMGCQLRASEAGVIARLTRLTYLRVDGNALENEGVCQLAALTKLRTLGVSNTCLSGSGVVQRLSMRLLQLEHLDIAGTELSPSEAQCVCGLGSLVEVRVSCQGGCMLPVSNLVNLQTLEMNGGEGTFATEVAASMQGLSALTSLCKLVLCLPSCDVTAAPWHTLARLQHLEVQDLLGSAGIAFLSLLSSLRHLSLTCDEEHRWLDVDDWRPLSSVTTLRTLLLPKNHMHTAAVRHLTTLSQLRTLDLSCNQLESNAASHLAPLSSLRRLNLSRNRMHARDTVSCLHGLSNLNRLSYLNLSCNQLPGAAAMYLSGCSGLHELDVSFNHMGLRDGPECLAALTVLTRLRILNACSNRLGPTAAAQLARLTMLDCLDLERNKLGLAGVVYLAVSLTSLRVLDVCGNNLGCAVVPYLGAMVHLYLLNVMYNELRPEHVEQLEQWLVHTRVVGQTPTEQPLL